MCRKALPFFDFEWLFLWQIFYFMDLLFQTWPWYFSGFLIAAVMFTLNYFGNVFGMSSNLRTICTIGGAGKFGEFFRFDWKAQKWGLAVVLGAMLGGFVAANYMSDPSNVALNPTTVEKLRSMNIDAPNGKLLPDAIFESNDPKMITILLIGGLLVGFGSRYAGGCTSGHAISGLSNLQIASLKAVIGFFVGGLIMVHLIFPYIF